MDVRITAGTIQQVVNADVVNASTLLSLSPAQIDALLGELLKELRGGIERVSTNALSEHDRAILIGAGGQLEHSLRANSSTEAKAGALAEFTGLLRKSFGDIAGVVLTAAKIYQVLSK